MISILQLHKSILGYNPDGKFSQFNQNILQVSTQHSKLTFISKITNYQNCIPSNNNPEL